jgi:hypothetical protein
MSFLIFLQNLPLPTLLAVTVLIGLLLCWGAWRWGGSAFGFPGPFERRECR